MRYREVSGDDAGMRLDNYLIRALKGVPRSRVYRVIRSGEVRINSARARPGTRLAAGDKVRIPPVRMRTSDGPGRPPDALLDRVKASIMQRGGDYLLINKPAWLAVHAGSGVRFGVIEVLRAAYPDDALELVHRLDRDTSGCLLVASGRAALNRLRTALGAPDTRKRYRALLAGRWQGGAVDVNAPLSDDCEISGERMVVVDAQGKSAHSRFVPQAVFAHTSLVDVTITTGRTHQIRVHATHLGHPVAGDPKYGDKRANRHLRGVGLKRMFLHAEELALAGAGEPPLRAPLPEELQNVLRKLENGA